MLDVADELETALRVAERNLRGRADQVATQTTAAFVNLNDLKGHSIEELNCLKCDPVSSRMRASYVPGAPRDRSSEWLQIGTAASASLQSDSVDPTRRSPDVFHSLGVGMEASEARREDGVSSADDCENLPNCALRCLPCSPSPPRPPPVPPPPRRAGARTVPSGTFIPDVDLGGGRTGQAKQLGSPRVR